MNSNAQRSVAPRTRDPQAKRKALLDAARSRFVELGFEATTTKLIAESAGVSEGVLFHQFGSKLNLFCELIRDFAEAGNERFLPKQAAELSSEQVVLGVLAFVESDRQLFKLIDDNKAMLVEQRVPLFQDYVVPAIEYRLRKQIAKGINFAGDPAIMAQIQIAIVESACRVAVETRSKKTREAIIAEAVRCLNAVNAVSAGQP